MSPKLFFALGPYKVAPLNLGYPKTWLVFINYIIGHLLKRKLKNTSKYDKSYLICFVYGW